MMKNRLLARASLYMASLAIFISLTACNISVDYSNVDVYVSDNTYDNFEANTSIEIFPKTAELITNNTNESIEVASIALAYEEHILLRQHIFMGKGDMVITGGDGMSWYYRPFGFDYHFIPMHVIDHIGGNEFHEWRVQFELLNPYGLRDFSLRALVASFGISMNDMIVMHEEILGRPISEIDELVIWARTVDVPSTECNDEAFKATVWRSWKSSSDFEALFSNDANVIWAAFPGFGVLYNDNVYSPEWILNNTERALYGELIPLSDIYRVLNTAIYDFWFINELTDTATIIYQSAYTTYASSTPFQLSFELNGGVGIPPITLNAWDIIMDALTVSVPVRAGYEFMGWYLDENFTVEITDVFRMPARNATLYARWELSMPTYHQLSFNLGNTPSNPTTPATISLIDMPVGVNILGFLAGNHDGFVDSPTREGYNFLGWYMDASFASRLTTTTTMPSGDVSLFARWERNPGGVSRVDFIRHQHSIGYTIEVQGTNLTAGQLELRLSGDLNSSRIRVDGSEISAAGSTHTVSFIHVINSHASMSLTVEPFGGGGGSSSIWLEVYFDGMFTGYSAEIRPSPDSGGGGGGGGGGPR